MRLTDKLLSFLNRVFDKRPHEFLALRLDYDGDMTWQVSDGFLTTSVSGGSGVNLSVDLSQYTVTELVYHLAAQPGYRIVYHDTSAYSNLSALVLLDGSDNPADSNGDHLYGYTSALYGYMEPISSALEEAETEIQQALRQMEIPNAELSWLDYWGSYFGFPRRTGELDPDYSTRIIVSVTRPRGNNVAIEETISKAIGGQKVTVEDVTEYGATAPLFDSSITFDGSHQYNASQVPLYGLFDVTYGYDLLSDKTPNQLANYIVSIVEQIRDAGTHMRSLLLQGGELSDTVRPASDALSMTIRQQPYYDGQFTFDGAATFDGYYTSQTL